MQSREKKKDRVNNSISTVNAKNPIPFEWGGSAFEYVTAARYIPFLYTDDDFGKTLLEARLLSNTQASCVSTKATFCAGAGMRDVNDKPLDKDFQGFLNSMNEKNRSASDINKKIFDSFFTFGNVPVEIVEVTVAKKKYLYINVRNFLEWRLGYPNNAGLVKYAVNSKLFLLQGILSYQNIKDARQVPLYDPTQPLSKKNWLEDGNVRRTMIWLTNETVGFDHYGMPESIGSLSDQFLEYKGTRFNLDNLENNTVIGGILALKGNLSQTEADKIGKTIRNSHTGDGKRGRIAVISSEEGIEGSEYHEYDTTRDASYLDMAKNCKQNIIMANQWHELLAGLDSGSSLGKGNSYLRTVYQLKKKTVIDPMQRFLITNFWQPLQGIITNCLGIPADQYELDIIDIDPVSSLGDVDPTNLITLNEGRKEFGLPEDNESGLGDKYLFELIKKSPSSGTEEDDPTEEDGGAKKEKNVPSKQSTKKRSNNGR